MVKRLLFLCGVIVALLALFVGGRRGPVPTIYDAEVFVSLSCKELSDWHDEVITASHDAEMAHFQRTGAFHDDLGLLDEVELPFVVAMMRFMQDNGITEAGLISPSAELTSLQRTAFYGQASAICASEPSLASVKAFEKAALTLGLLHDKTPGRD